MKEYDAGGVRFRYPESWSLADESTEDKVAVTVQSDGTAFWTLAVFPDAAPPEHVVESVVAAYRDDYPELDIYPAETFAGPEGQGVRRDIEFVCLELIAAAHVEAFEAGGRTVMVLSQGADAELEERQPVLDAMTASIEVTGEGSGSSPWPDELFGG